MVVGHSYDHDRRLERYETGTPPITRWSPNIPPRPRQDGGLRSFIYRLLECWTSGFGQGEQADEPFGQAFGVIEGEVSGVERIGEPAVLPQ